MNQNKTHTGFAELLGALKTALQWRLLLLWIVVLAIPTTIVALPLSSVLGALLDHSVHSQDWAQHFNALAMGDIMGAVGHFGAGIVGAMNAATIITLLLSPFLTGMVIAAARASQRLSLGGLIHGGIGEYWRLLRMLLWALVPFGIAIIIGSAVMAVAKKHAEAAILQSSADMVSHIAMIVMIILLVLAHVMVESGRAQFAGDASLRSATRALGRGITMLWRRPLATFGMYFGVSIIGYILAFILMMWRIRLDAVGVFGFLFAQLVTQLIVIVLAWQRSARIFALADVVRATTARV